MKAMKIPVAVLSLLLAIALVDSYLLTRQCEDWHILTDNMERYALAANWENAQQELDVLQENWSQWQTYLHIIIDHQEIDRVENLLALCRIYTDEKDTVALRATVSELRCQFSLLAENEQFNIKNVL